MSRARQLPPGVTARSGVYGPTYRGRVRQSGRSLSQTFDDPHEAGAWVQETKSRLRRGDRVQLSPLLSAPLNRSSITVQAAAEHFFQSIVKGTVRGRSGQPYTPSTLIVYERAVRRCLISHIGDLPLDTVTRRELRQLLDHLAPETGAGTLYAAMAALKAIYSLAERDGLFEGSNPCDGITNHQPDAKRRGRALGRDEQNRLLGAAREHDLYHGRSLMFPLIRLLLSTGLRIGEAVAVQYDSVGGLDLAAGRLHVRQIVSQGLTDEKSPRPRLMLCKRTKTPSSRATVLLNPATVDALVEHQRVTCAQEGDLAFTGRGGQLLYPSRCPLDRAWMDVKRRSGLEPPGLRLHDLRHTFGSTLMALNHRLPTVARRMRHKSPDVTLRIYAHELGDEAARDRYDDWLRGDEAD